MLILSAVILRFINLPQFDFLKSLLTVLCVNMSKIAVEVKSYELRVKKLYLALVPTSGE
jgi:hypothetical protein